MEAGIHPFLLLESKIIPKICSFTLFPGECNKIERPYVIESPYVLENHKTVKKPIRQFEIKRSEETEDKIRFSTFNRYHLFLLSHSNPIASLIDCLRTKLTM